MTDQASWEVDRVVFQYSDRCNMRCPYCYCPFFGEPVDFATCSRIVDRCHDLGVKVITFGGGDPFMYDSFRQVLVQSHNLGLETHVDTNGIALMPSDYILIADYVSLLSLPLDGHNDPIHAQMRNSPGHFNVVTNHLSQLVTLKPRCRLKINTVVAATNYTSIPRLADFLMQYPIQYWSLFQFWPLGSGLRTRLVYDIPDQDYTNLVNLLRERQFPFSIESGTVTERAGYHLFVKHTGTLYIHNPDDRTAYIDLGSIFDDRVVEHWTSFRQLSIHPGALARYRSMTE